MNPGVIFFIILAAAAVASAAAMLFSRNAIYAVLFLILNFTAVAVIYLTLGAPFIALAQITVYAGAIMILFLFVIMMLGSEKLPDAEPLAWQRPLAIILTIVLLGEGAYLFVTRGVNLGILPAVSSEFASPQAIGMELYSQYMLPFEITSVLLLVGVIGAVVLTRVEKKRGQS